MAPQDHVRNASCPSAQPSSFYPMCWAPTRPTPLLVVPGRRAGTDRVVNPALRLPHWRPELFGVSGAGQRLGPGAAGQGHSLQLGHVWQCTEPRCLSQWAPCPQPETLRRRPCQLRELGGGGSTPDPRAPAGPTSSPPLPGPSWSPLAWPSFCGPMFHVFRACGPQEGLESDLPELQNPTSLGVRWPCPPGLLHCPPLPGRPLPYTPLPALSIRRLSQDTPITSPQTAVLRTLERLECAQRWRLRRLTWRASGALAGRRLEVHVTDLCRGRAS